MSNVAVVYSSATGHVYEVAEAVVKGAKDAGAKVRVRRLAVGHPVECFAENGRSAETITTVRR